MACACARAPCGISEAASRLRLRATVAPERRRHTESQWSVGFRKHAVGWRVRSSALGGAGTLSKGKDSMLALMSHAVNACDTWQWVATGGEFPNG